MQPQVEIELRAPSKGTHESVAFYFDTEIRFDDRKLTIFGGVIFYGRDGGYNPQLPSKPGKKDSQGHVKSFPIIKLDRNLWETVIGTAKRAAEARNRSANAAERTSRATY